MRKKNKMACILLYAAVSSTIFCACTEKESVVENKFEKDKQNLPQVDIQYGEIHNGLLNLCLEECYNIYAEDYFILDSTDVNYYQLYAEYTRMINATICNEMEISGAAYDDFDQNLAVLTPTNFWELRYYQRQLIAENFHALDMAITLVEDLFSTRIEMISDGELEGNIYWSDLVDSIEIYAENIYSASVDLCESEEEFEGLNIMLGVMVGSLQYWADDNNITAWRMLSWDANCHYLDGLNLESDEYEQLQEDYCKKTGEKVVDFVLADVTGAAYGGQIGSIFPGVGTLCGMLAVGSICSGLVALSWD